MVGRGGTPAMQHRGEADLHIETLRVGCDREQRLGARLERQVVDHGLAYVLGGASSTCDADDCPRVYPGSRWWTIVS
jgi:hypothetical protein